MKHLLTLFLLLTVVTAFGQDDADVPALWLNPEVAGNVTSYSNSSNNLRLGYSAGLNLRLGRTLYIQPGAHFVKQAVNANIDTANSVAAYRDISAYYAQFPVLVGVKLLAFRFYGGIAPSVFLGGEVKNSSIRRQDFNNTINAVRAGVGVDILAVTLSTYFDWGVNDVYSTRSGISYRSFSFAVGVKIW